MPVGTSRRSLVLLVGAVEFVFMFLIHIVILHEI